jgi:hypothetical protein
MIGGIPELVSLAVRFIAVTQKIDTDETNPKARLRSGRHCKTEKARGDEHNWP